MGTDEHVETVLGLLAKAGASEADLMCGAHPISHKETAQRLKEAGLEPTPIRNNCSGKHAGMLAQARHRGLPLAPPGYIAPTHAVQP